MANDSNALVLAVSSGDVGKVKELIAAGVPVNQQDSSGDLPITDAAQRGRPELVKLLLQAGANVNATTKSKRSALMWAAEGGHADIVEVLLAAGAGAQDLTRLAQTVGKELPEDFKAAYGIHNGQQGGGDLIPAIAENEEGYFLMPTKAIISEWKSWKSLVDNGEFKGKESSPETGIQGAWWHPGWLPFASNGGGDSICLDLAPAPGGTRGQVITMNHETSRRQLLAPSFSAWFTEVAQTIEADISQPGLSHDAKNCWPVGPVAF